MPNIEPRAGVERAPASPDECPVATPGRSTTAAGLIPLAVATVCTAAVLVAFRRGDVG